MGAERGLLALAAQAARSLAAQDGATAAFLAGSLVAGLGNETSDVDIYLAGPDVVASRRQLEVERTRFDVQYLPLADLAAVADRLTAADLGAGAIPVADRDVAFADRLCGGEVVIGEQVLAPIRDRLTEMPALMRRLTISRWLSAAHFAFEDFTGLRRSGDADAALMLARTMLISAGKAIAAACGDRYAGEKWAWQQLRRSAPPEFPLAHFTTLSRADHDDAGLDEVTAFTQTCLAAVATLGWHGVDLARWPRWRPGDGPLRRTSGFLPRAYQDSVVLTSPAARRIQLRPEVALVWALCDGVSEDEVVEAAEQLRHAEYGNLTAQRCRAVIEKLTSAKLVG